ncbi:MAG: adenylate kinase family protein [archaeon]
MTILICTGTPGTGKTELSKELAKQLKLKYVDVNNVVKKEKLVEEYDEIRETNVVDEKKLAKALVKLIKNNKNMIIDSHMSHEIPAKYVDWCIVTKCDETILKKRLEKKGYPKEKVEENVDSEILEICLNEAEQKGHKILVVDTSKKTTKKIASELKNLLHD